MNLLLVFGVAFAAFPISHSTEAFCSLTHDEGTGMNFTFSLYYDASIDLCQPFLYRGEGGNANRFRNERECIRTCSSKAEESYPMDESLACHFRKAKGQCGGQYLRFYYDSIHDKCKTFLWTGCIGNGNRFVDRESCNATCAGIHDEGDEVEEEEPDTPVALICGMVFGVVGSIMIIVVIVLSVRSTKEKDKKTPRKVKEAPAELPLQDRGTEVA